MYIPWKLAFAVPGGILATGVLLAAVSLTGAQTQTLGTTTSGTGTPGASTTPAGTQTPAPTPFNGEVVPSFIQQLAQNLNLPVEKVEQAFKDAALTIIDEQVAEGTIAPDQAAQIKQQIEGGQLPLGSLLQDPFSTSGVIPGQGVIDSAAHAIGIDSDALVTELRAGKTVAQVAQDHNVSLDDVESQTVDDARSRLDEYVKTGAISQQEADDQLHSLQSRLDTLLHRQFAPLSSVTPGTSTPGTPDASGTTAPRGAAVTPST